MKLNINLNFGNREDKNKQLNEFTETILKIKSKEEMLDFLKGIMTPKELLEFPHRLEIVRMLKKGVSHHDIAGKLGVGIATVTRGSRELQKGRFKTI